MTYELAKQLKDAGFPQRRNPVRFQDTHVDSEGNLITEGDMVHVPTLSELIEACGDDIDTLQIGYGKGFIANGVGEDHNGIPYKRGEGATPEEAVAKLWLELNKDGQSH